MPSESRYPATQVHQVIPASLSGLLTAPAPEAVHAPASETGRTALTAGVPRADSTQNSLHAEGKGTKPDVRTTLFGFQLIDEIGRGAFARVYLARQGDLSDRLVVLKVTTDARQETLALAQLQHTNIVPIHSVHRTDKCHVVCMPFLGTTTLVDVYHAVEGMPTLPNSGRDLFSTLNTRSPGTFRPVAAERDLARPPAHQPVLAALEGRSYVEAVLWLAARLADGLDHAHARGVVHRDLKPANVLLTDDGQPMLLDFNLALTRDPEADAARSGGTPQYMSPEQLEAFAGTARVVDGRSDLYSLGAIVYELLTRRTPFPRRKPAGPGAIEAMVADRQGPPPRLRAWNRSVTPAAEAIVRRCLEPDPAKRYPSAAELREDIERHLSDRPLAHTPEPSVRERARKWRRRNRQLTSAAGLLTTAGVAAIVLIVAYLTWGVRLARLEAADTYRTFADEAQTAQVRLLDGSADRARLDDGVRLCEAALGRYGAADSPNWAAGPAVAHLPAADRDRVKGQVGELLVLLSRAVARQAVLDTAHADPQPALRRAFALTDAALACYPAAGEPRAVWDQRADLSRLLGRPDEARQMAKRASERPVESPADRFLIAHQFAAKGEYRRAVPYLREITRDDPRAFIAWFVLGVCHLELLQDTDAAGCFNSCLALRPDDPWAWYNRGLSARRRKDLEQARTDFDRVVALNPGFARGYMNRGLTRHDLKDYAGAIEDLTKALDLGGPATSILFRRAAARRAAGDAAGADRDRSDALRREPADEDGFIDRGLARVNTDPAGALADFDAALKLNPLSFRGLQNKSAVLADKFHRDADSLKAIDEAVRLYPDSVLARAGRGVLLARAGQADRAQEDARAAMALDASPATVYQVGCIYALLSAKIPDHRPKAVQLVSSALKRGYGLDLIGKDADLDPLRSDPEFQALMTAANTLRIGTR